jgi:hypothetical protein
MSGYVPATWSEASAQLHCTRGLMGAILGVGHPAIAAYGRFLLKYTRMINRLESEIDQVHGRRLGPDLVTFHVQLVWRNWLATQLETGETGLVDVPAFSQGMDMLEVQNNLMWLPTVTNVPILLALRTPARTPAPAPAARNPGRTTQPASGGGANAGRADAAAAAPRRDPGGQVRNTNHAALFLANTPFSRNVRSRSVTAAIAVAGPPPNVTRGGVSMCMCVSWHGKGMCVEPCKRAADHGNLTVEEAVDFHAWCDAAYA